MRVRCWALLLSAISIAALTSCNRPVRTYTDGPFPTKLSDWHLFTASSPALKPNKGVLPYDLNTPLFSDYADKYRFVWMPPGTSAQYKDDAPFDFPLGTILAKTFAFPQDGHADKRLIETRLLVHTNSGWMPLLYRWDDAQHDATLQLVPDPVPIKYTDTSGTHHDFTYVMPNANECHQCHDINKVLLPIGPKARNLNKDFAYADCAENQLARWARVGYLRDLPDAAARPRTAKWDDSATGSLDDRARAYLDNNCAHCHQPGGQAGYTGVDFRLTQRDLRHQGLCKSPNSAGAVGGLGYDLVPGHPEQSILIYRLESTAPKVSMPALSRDVVHREGVDLLRRWIKSLGAECSAFPDSTKRLPSEGSVTLCAEDCTIRANLRHPRP